MRYWIAIFVSVFFVAQASAADWNEAPEWKFSQSLDTLAFKCDMQADFDREQRRYGTRSDGAELTACIAAAGKKGQEQYKVALDATESKAEVKAVYARWLTYLSTISPYGPVNRSEKAAFKDAVSNLKAALQAR